MTLSPAKIKELSAAFEGLEPREILQWATDWFPGRVEISTAFGPEGLVIIDIAQRQVSPRMPVFTIDTGFFFPETHALIAKVEARYGILVERLRPKLTPEEQAAQYGPELFRRDPNQCCFMRKVLPLRAKLPSLDAMVTGLRRSQSDTRKDAATLELHETPEGHRYLKVNPLVAWSRERVWDYIGAHRLDYNELHDRGYASIGCSPDCCTRPVKQGEDERAGRWAGREKTECGLHTFSRNVAREPDRSKEAADTKAAPQT
jgi:phosphoadenosine phosphosulfate reductase